MADVVGTGLIAVDHMFLAERQKSKASSLEYLGSAGGGSVGNTLTMLALLGHRTSVTGLVGNDDGARIIRSDFTRFGVNHTGLVQRGTPRDPRPTRQYSHLIRSDGSHAFLEKCLKCGSSLRRTFQMTESDVTPVHLKSVKSASLLFLDRVNGATVRLAKVAESQQIPIGFDLGFARFGTSLESLRRVLRSCTVVKTQESVLRQILKVSGMDAVHAWKQTYPDTKLLLVTRGSNGVRGFWRGKDIVSFFDLPAIRCEHLRDSAGAGDVLQAAAYHEFLLSSPPKDDEDVRRRVNASQALASLKCNLLGARSLQRALFNQRLQPRDVRDIARGVVESGFAANSFPSTIGLPPPLSNPFRLAAWGGCPVCGQPIGSKTRPRKALGPTQRYRDALSVSHLRMSHAFQVGLSMANLLTDRFDGPAMFVGSGGSLSAASFASTLLVKGLGRLATALPPFEIWNLSELEPTVGVCLLSHGGENKDILMAAERLSKLRHQRVLVVTSTPDSPLTLVAKTHGWMTLLVEGQERGFVATSGLLSLVSAITGAFSSPAMAESAGDFLRYDNLVKCFSQSLKSSLEISTEYSTELRSHHIVVLASGWGWPAAADFESKLVEGGVCTVELTEMKNFTHGRYVNSFHHRENRHFVLFVSPEEQELARFMRTKLTRYFESIITIETSESGVAGAIDLMIRGLFLAGQLAFRAGVDLANPRYPSEARGLYGWAPQVFLESKAGPSGSSRGASGQRVGLRRRPMEKRRVLSLPSE